MSDAYVPTPCINICTLDQDSGYCMGCSRTQKEKDEDLERSIDWDKVKKLSNQGHSSKEIQDAMDKGLKGKDIGNYIKGEEEKLFLS